MIFSTVVALVYFCLAIPMAVFSTEWSNEQNPSEDSLGSGDFPDEVYTISTSLAAASVSLGVRNVDISVMLSSRKLMNHYLGVELRIDSLVQYYIMKSTWVFVALFF